MISGKQRSTRDAINVAPLINSETLIGVTEVRDKPEGDKVDGQRRLVDVEAWNAESGRWHNVRHRSGKRLQLTECCCLPSLSNQVLDS
uniref:MOSC domain-containing protein n=1 Tax=Heterorhabditis bacteriophora TaxID=37862 RepID=A0A1I7WZG5_HETBA